MNKRVEKATKLNTDQLEEVREALDSIETYASAAKAAMRTGEQLSREVLESAWLACSYAESLRDIIG